MPTQPYYLKGTKIRVPGTTTVISASLAWGQGALMHWAYTKGTEGKPFREETKKAADIGTLAHAMAEAHVKGKPEPRVDGLEADMLEPARTAYESFCAWEEMSQLVIEQSEIGLVSEIHKYGGTLDGIGTVTGKRALIDFKTSNHTYGSHVIQVAAYAKLWEENYPDDILEGGAHILRFGKDAGNFVHYYIPRKALVAKPWDAFLALRLLYDLKKPVEALA